MPASDRATQLLNRLSEGDRSVTQELMDLVYEELRTLAASHMARERSAHTLQPTALVHEAFLKLVDAPDLEFEGRRQFYALASKVMRSLLVDHARKRVRKKRGGDRVRLTLGEDTPAPDGPARDTLDVLDLHEALGELAEVDAGLAQVVELRFFGGLTVRETADAVELPLRTVERRLQVANAWLRDRLDG